MLLIIVKPNVLYTHIKFEIILSIRYINCSKCQWKKNDKLKCYDKT